MMNWIRQEEQAYDDTIKKIGRLKPEFWSGQRMVATKWKIYSTRIMPSYIHKRAYEKSCLAPQQQ
jgi:hypothetical protein